MRTELYKEDKCIDLLTFGQNSAHIEAQNTDLSVMLTELNMAYSSSNLRAYSINPYTKASL